jgi:2-oxoglutarate dehydrogenase E2 component (dihydrolipoamide succinyltransferase)
MPQQVIMPQLGESVVEGTITRWLKQKGELVKEYEPLVEINTDKVDTELPSPANGVLLDILISEGAIAKAGDLLAWIGQPGDNTAVTMPQPPPAQTQTAPVQETGKAEYSAKPTGVPFTPGRHPELGFISPVVAKLANAQAIDLSQVTGSGQGGRITKNDLMDFLDKTAGEKPLEEQHRPEKREEKEIPSTSPESSLAAGQIVPLTAVRKAIAEHMLLSRRTSPHVTTVMEADLSRVSAHRQANKEAFGRDGVNLTFTAYFCHATAAALREFPIVNSSWTDTGIQLHREINLGVATSLGEAGLIVPVIRTADHLSLLGLARAINDLANRARQRQLKPDEVKGGTFTITNHGTSGSLFAMPIINQPQCAILGVGMIQKRVVVVSDEYGNDSIAIRPMAYISLTFDHRILDGWSADVFLGKVVENLEQRSFT